MGCCNDQTFSNYRNATRQSSINLFDPCARHNFFSNLDSSRPAGVLPWSVDPSFQLHSTVPSNTFYHSPVRHAYASVSTIPFTHVHLLHDYLYLLMIPALVPARLFRNGRQSGQQQGRVRH